MREAYYDGLPGPIGTILGTGGSGWHAETAVHIVRLIVSGALDRHPALKLIVGHMGEGLPAMLARFEVFDAATSSYLNRTAAGPSSIRCGSRSAASSACRRSMAALMTFGADRILFSVDYPFSPISVATDFLERLPISPEGRAKIAHGNADRLLKLKAMTH